MGKKKSLGKDGISSESKENKENREKKGEKESREKARGGANRRGKGASRNRPGKRSLDIRSLDIDVAAWAQLFGNGLYNNR